MNKAELILAIHEKLNAKFTKVETESILNVVIDTMQEGIKKDKQLKLVGFGSFKILSRKARKGVNPKTGAPIKIKASNTIKYTPGKTFKALVQSKKK